MKNEVFGIIGTLLAGAALAASSPHGTIKAPPKATVAPSVSEEESAEQVKDQADEPKVLPKDAKAEPKDPTPPSATPVEPTTFSADAEPTGSRVRPWGGVQHLTGPGYGFVESYSTLEGFIPVFQTQNHILFGDLRGLLTNTSVLSANLGAGYRYYSPAFNRIYGGNVFFDNRDTGLFSFNQVGFGVETLGRYWDARANAYFVVGDESKESGAFFTNPTFVQYFIQLDRVAANQAAMSGFDAEIGAPIYCPWGLKAYIGTYNFQVSNSPQAWGIKTRLEERLTDNLDLNVTYASDQVFGNSIIFQAGYRFGGGRAKIGSSRCNVYARRADRIERNHQIVVTDTTTVSHVLATDPNTGRPIIVKHADSAAAPGGDGTVERPFQTLAQLQTGSNAGDILFLHANSTFTQPSLTLKNNQRLLGEGIDHIFTATQGTFLLPRATNGTNLPLLLRTAGATNAVTLAMDNEVSGLRYQRTGGPGGFIFGTGNLGTFNINRNQTTGGPSAVNLINISGNGLISENSFTTGSITAGIALTEAAGNVRLLIEDNQINVGTLASGILITQTGTSTMVIGIRDNQFTSGTLAASVTDTVVGPGASQVLQLRNNVGTGGYILTGAGSTFRVENTLGTNTPAPTTIGTITIVPVGTAGFPE